MTPVATKEQSREWSPVGAGAPSGRAAASKVPAPMRPTKLRRRPALVGLGVALVVLGALAMMYLTATLGRTVQVLAVTQAVQRGQAIGAQSLTAVDVPTGPTALRYVPADQLDQVAGQLAAVELTPGALLTPASYTKALAPGAGKSIVGVALTSSQMPTSDLHAGDHVRVVETSSTGAEASSDNPRTIAAIVISTKPATLGDLTIVNVEVDHAQAAALAARAATGRVALILDPPQE